MSNATPLLDGVTANVALESITMFAVKDVIRSDAGSALVTVRSSNYGSGTVTIYGGFESDGSDAVPLENGAFTENQGREFRLPRIAFIGATLTGATSPSAVTVLAGGD